MSDKNIPAFPLEMVYTQENEKFNGMTLRDYFAAKAMQPFLDTLVKQGWRSDDLQTVAETCYRAADAMMKAREA